MKFLSKNLWRTGSFVFFLGALLAGCGDGSSPIEDPTDPTPVEMSGKLVIRYIQRLPELEYVWGSDNPTRDGWPTPSSQVQWQAHVLNQGPNDLKGVGYRWTLDGEEVDSGRMDLPAEGETTVEYPWTWTFDRHTLGFVIDPANEVEEEARNDTLKIFTDALTIGFCVEQTLYDLFAEHQVELGIGSMSFEDWAQRQIQWYNDMFEAAKYPETPEGILDRYRLDKITLVADSPLPLIPVPDDLISFSPVQATPATSSTCTAWMSTTARGEGPSTSWRGAPALRVRSTCRASRSTSEGSGAYGSGKPSKAS